MIVAISGTPGTGKTSVSKVLMNKGYHVIELGDFVRDRRLFSSVDRKRGSLEVDTDDLDKALRSEIPQGTVLLVGHLSHFLTVDMIIVLRCRPSVLCERLEARGWSEKKIKENMEAEALDVILIESLDSNIEVLEIDTTDRDTEGTGEAIEEILRGERQKYAVGHVDWSDEVLNWF